MHRILDFEPNRVGIPSQSSSIHVQFQILTRYIHVLTKLNKPSSSTRITAALIFRATCEGERRRTSRLHNFNVESCVKRLLTIPACCATIQKLLHLSLTHFCVVGVYRFTDILLSRYWLVHAFSTVSFLHASS